MHNRLVLTLGFGLIASISLSAQITITDTHEGGKPVPKPAPFNMKSAQVSRQTPLNNRNIIQMVKSGQQQAAILSALRSRRGSFDLSPEGCSALRTANVSQTILNAMGDGSRPQCVASMPSQGAVQTQHTLNGGTLLGNRNATLLGNHGAAVATPSNGCDPVSLNPQPLPPRMGKSAKTSSAINTKSATGTAGINGTSPAPQH